MAANKIQWRTVDNVSRFARDTVDGADIIELQQQRIRVFKVDYIVSQFI
jgi:hypothetical protein